MRAMQPVADKLLSGHTFRLGNLRFVMRENVIHAAAMNIELLAKNLRGHRAALDVPAGTTAAPRTFPANRAVRLVPRFPKRKVADVFLVVIVGFHPSGRLQLIEIE